MADGLPNTAPFAAYTQSRSLILEAWQTSPHGLSPAEASARLARYGLNTIPRAKVPGIGLVFLHQFISPLIYILVAAAIFSIAIEEFSDALFISAVLLINAVIGTIQEYSAQRAATALQQLVSTRCRVLREGETYEIDAEELVPGDILLLESGQKIPADVRLLDSHDLEVDESLLTGESVGVAKEAEALLTEPVFLGDRRNMAFAGTMVNRGRGRGVVVSTALASELGQIAETVLSRRPVKAPLLVRMETFTNRVALLVGIAALLLAAVAFSRGIPINEVFLLAVALAVSAIPEGLPVALTVALAVGMQRMARRNVIVRRLIAVEALGSCTTIVTDKTGTLTVNQLTVRRIAWPHGDTWEVSGEGTKPTGTIRTSTGAPSPKEQALLERLCRASVLANEAVLSRREGGWTHQGDAVDVALLVMAHKAGMVKEEMLTACPEIDVMPFESERLFAASLNRIGYEQHVSVKGAVERVLPMCHNMATPTGDVSIDHARLLQSSNALAGQGYRVLALAAGTINMTSGHSFGVDHLQGLTLLGLVAMIDPLRSEAKEAVANCHKAGIHVAMVTGDHPTTAATIAKELGLIDDAAPIVTGPQLGQATEPAALDALTPEIRVFARVEPHQKLDIVQSLQRNGHFVAASGDGANDAPALRAAQIGVAMGKSGTDVARETAGLIITDDNFSSIVAGVEEGRIAYANVRKVIFLLISTGAAEIVLFTLALLTGQPLPLLAVQLLWLNLVTNGIQDVALAFEPAEGNELSHPPRSPREPIFDRLMIERVVISAVAIGTVAFFTFQWLLNLGVGVDTARNGTMLLMVLFENVHVFNCRSESRSALRHNPLRNPILLFGTLAAQLIHIGAMYTPWLRDVLHIQPVSFNVWLTLLGLALTVLIVMEVHKALWRRLRR